MTVLVILAVAGVILVAVLHVAAQAVNAVMRFLRHFTLLRRFLAGHPMDGSVRTDATFWQAPVKALHPTAARSWWHWRPGWHRAAMRVGALVLVLLIAAGFRFATVLTEDALLALLAAGAVLLCWHVAYRIRGWQHERHYVRPLERTLAARMGAVPDTIEIVRDGAAVREVTIEWPPEAEIGPAEQDHVLEAVTTRLAIEAPDASWKLKGRERSVTLTHSDPPPPKVTWEDIEDAVRSAGPDELVVGIGKRSQIVTVSLSLDSPHFGQAMGTGGGKSNLAAFWLVQRLMKGDFAIILDAKWFSHPWAFKDMDANYGQLPNVAYARTTADLHNAAIWLGIELQRRTDEAEKGVNAKGHIIRGDIGPRLWIVAEEMNLATPRLKQYWAEERAGDKDLPKRSPALDGLAAVSFAGRAVKMNEDFIGQMLTAASLGGGDVRENIGVRALARYTANSWKMQAGDLPMPPPSDIPGRIQCIASGVVHEAQVPLMDMEQVRELAVSGTVTECPADMPGIGTVARVPLLAASSGGPGQGFVLGHGRPPGRPPGTLTLREAAAEGLFPSLAAARKAVQRRELEPAGRDGAANLYSIGDLAAALRK